MSESDKTQLARVAGRIVGMFERYIRNIDPEDQDFLKFLAEHLASRNVDPSAIPHSELYKYVKEGIRKYLQKKETEKPS